MDPAPRTTSMPTGPDAKRKLQATGDTVGPAAMSIVDPDEAADLAAAQAGDDDAFARIFDRLGPVVLSLCRQRSLAEADDATQETFIRAHRLLHKVDSPQRLRPWLYAIARRVCSERNRAARRRSRHEGNFALSREEVQTPPGRAGQTTVARTDDPSGQSEQIEQLDRLSAAMEKLDARERLAIHIYYLEADPVKAATTALDLSRSGYYKMLTRAREHLASLMK